MDDICVLYIVAVVSYIPSATKFYCLLSMPNILLTSLRKHMLNILLDLKYIILYVQPI